nr:hypothetical protein [Woeseia oceani]
MNGYVQGWRCPVLLTVNFIENFACVVRATAATGSYAELLL